MTTNELQNLVLIESIALAMILAVIISALKRWKLTLLASSTAAAVAIFKAWSLVMAVGSIMVYGPAATLLWFELDKKNYLFHNTRQKYVRASCWALLAFGVCMLIAKNVYNIYTYLQ